MTRLLNPLVGYPLAALDFLRTVGHVAMGLRLSSEPLEHFRIEQDFFGVNVATGDIDGDRVGAVSGVRQTQSVGHRLAGVHDRVVRQIGRASCRERV